jgi:hypothetical protein
MVPESCATALERCGARLLILEDQFVTDSRRARSVIELAFTMGVTVGWVLHDFWQVGAELTLMHVAPATWQATQRAAHGGVVGKGEAAKLALRQAEYVLGETLAWKSADSKARTGIAAAWGIAEWWRGVVDG